MDWTIIYMNPLIIWTFYIVWIIQILLNFFVPRVFHGGLTALHLSIKGCRHGMRDTWKGPRVSVNSEIEMLGEQIQGDPMTQGHSNLEGITQFRLSVAQKTTMKCAKYSSFWWAYLLFTSSGTLRVAIRWPLGPPLLNDKFYALWVSKNCTTYRTPPWSFENHHQLKLCKETIFVIQWIWSKSNMKKKTKYVRGLAFSTFNKIDLTAPMGDNIICH